MRRKDREVSDFSQIVNIMEACDCCRLGLADNGEAYIVPMNFGYDVIDENVTLYFHCSNEGRKLDLLSEETKVSFEMDTGHELLRGDKGCEFSYLYQSIMGTGNIEILKSNDEKIMGLNKIMLHYTKKSQWSFDESALDKTTVLRLNVKSLSCKKH